MGRASAITGLQGLFVARTAVHEKRFVLRYVARQQGSPQPASMSTTLFLEVAAGFLTATVTLCFLVPAPNPVADIGLLALRLAVDHKMMILHGLNLSSGLAAPLRGHPWLMEVADVVLAAAAEPTGQARLRVACVS